MKKKHSKFLCGKIINPLKLNKNYSVANFIDEVYGNSGFNARRLSEACQTFKRMIESDATIALTLAGAMTPIGMSGPIIQLIEKGFIDFIVSTGGNLYHDLHRACDFPMHQGSPNIDDNVLYKEGIARIYDIFIQDDETMIPTDKYIVKSIIDKVFNEPVSTADIHYYIGKYVLETASHPERSILAQAAKHRVPVYTSAPGDSSIGMNLIIPHFFQREVPLDPLLDIIETTAIVRDGKKNGVVEIGGGHPKNFYLQTQPTLWQILMKNIGGHDFFIQLTTDSPHWGGLSGATPSEAKSWGKVQDAYKNNAVVYSCASLTFPLIAQYVFTTCKKRPLKHLLEKKNGLIIRLLKECETNSEFIKSYKGILGKQPRARQTFLTKKEPLIKK